MESQKMDPREREIREKAEKLGIKWSITPLRTDQTKLVCKNCGHECMMSEVIPAKIPDSGVALRCPKCLDSNPDIRPALN